MRKKRFFKKLLLLPMIAFLLFLASLVVYFFNLDMKLSAKLMPWLTKIYDNMERDTGI